MKRMKFMLSKMIQINNYSDGIKLLNQNNNTLLVKEEIINPGTIIELILTDDINVENTYSIEYSLIVIEPE